MKFIKFLLDKLFFVISFIIVFTFSILVFKAFNINSYVIIVISFVLLIFLIFTLLYEYFKKAFYYNTLINNVNNLDKAYLVLETLNKPDFYDGEILNEILYTINKSMIENINSINKQNTDFKEYIEMWIHEVKIPISALSLMTHNKKDLKSLEQIKRINNYIEQVLYYVRSDTPEKDYLIKYVNLDRVINNVALKNKDELLENNISFQVEKVNLNVYTDTKWLEFILNQIINNSIKYKRKNNSYIKIYSKKEKNRIFLYIEDNGIGIPKEDLKRVFDKSFTGVNGREKSKSTGMGLYISDKLCKKLGHKITIESVRGKYTRVCIIFEINDFYKMNF